MFAVLTAPSRLTCGGGGGEGYMCTLMCMYEWARVSVSVCLCLCLYVDKRKETRACVIKRTKTDTFYSKTSHGERTALTTAFLQASVKRAAVSEASQLISHVSCKAPDIV